MYQHEGVFSRKMANYLDGENDKTIISGSNRRSSSYVNPSLTQSFGHCRCELINIRLSDLLWCHQTPYDFTLTVTRNSAIAQKSRQNFLMPEVLTPCLEIFRGLTDILTKMDKGISEAMRVEIWQASISKGLAKYFTDGRGIAPVVPRQPCRFKLASSPLA